MSGAISKIFGGDDDVAPALAAIGGSSAAPMPSTPAPAAPVTPPPPTGPSEAESKATKLVDAETQRSERQRIEQIQRQLRLETLQNGRGRGIRSLIGSLGGGRSGYLGSG